MYVFVDRDWEGAPYFLGAALLVAAAGMLLLVSLGGGSSDPATVPRATNASAAVAPPLAVRREPAGRSFAVAGAVFTVEPDPRARWAGSAHGETARPGQHWLVVAVDVINRDRNHFNPGLLSYLVRGPHGALYAPVRAGVVGPAGLGQATGLPVGARAEERLVFSLPASLLRPVLAIQPSPGQALEVRVPLSAAQ